jgi:RNA polymerase sigma factor (TIGR02999 family)
MAADPKRDPTELLLQSRGVAPARDTPLERLFSLIYEDLRRLASTVLHREADSHTLRPTALVHELFLRLVDRTRIDIEDRARFMALAARAMRHILIDYSRRRNALRRGGGWRRVALAEDLGCASGPDLDMMALEQAMQRLEAEDPRSASVAEMRLFAGLPLAEIAVVVGLSERTAAGDWAFARRFLQRALS